MPNHEPELNRWSGTWPTRLGRRRFLTGMAGVAGMSLLACGQDESTPTTAPGTPATGTPATGTPATSTPSPTTETPAPTLTATAVVGDTGTPVPGGTLKLAGWTGGYVGWDPRYGDDWDPVAYYTFTHDRLLAYRYGPKYGPTDFTPTPSLAEGWEQVDDLTVTFQVRAGVKWRDVEPVNGRELTAEDIKYSYEQYGAPESSHRPPISAIETVTSPDRVTLVVTTGEPFAPLLSNMANPHYAVIAPEVIQKFGTLKDQTTLIGSGPWYLDEFEEGVKAAFVRNPTYWRGPDGVTDETLPYIERIESSLDAEWQTSVAQFRTGELAAPGNWFGFWGLEGQSVADVESLRAAVPGMQEVYYARPYMDRHIFMLCDRPPFGDVRVRQAVSMCLDRDAWLNNIFEGRSSRGREFAETNPWFLPTEQLGDGAKYQQYDLAGAKQLMAAAGFADGFTTRLHVPSSSGPALVSEAEFLAEQLRAIDIEAEIQVYSDSAAWASGPFVGKFDEGLGYGYGESFYDPDPFFDVYKPESAKNRSHVDDAQLLDMIAKQRRTLDPQQRREIIDDIQRHTGVQRYYVVTVDGPSMAAWQPWLKNWMMMDGADYGQTFIEAWVAE